MKTAEVIRQLLEADPGGQLEVSVGNIDIHFVGRCPVSWDGAQQILARDGSRPGSYNIVGAEIRRSGPDKVQIHTLSIEEAILEDSALPVSCPEDRREDVERWRREAIEVDRDVAEWRASRVKGPSP